MPAIDPQVLLEEAKCYACYANASLAELLKLALLSRIAQAGGGGGSQTPWTSDIDGGCFNLNNVCKFNGIGVYRALLTQTGTDNPVATVLENTLGGTVVWTRDDDTITFGTLAGGFPASRTAVSLGNVILGASASLLWTDANTVTIYTSTDGILSATFVEILVYPATPQCPDCAS